MSTPKPLDDRLVNWLRERMRQACDVTESVQMSRQFGYSDDAITTGIEIARPRVSVLRDGPMPAPPLIRRAPPALRNIGAPKLDLYALDGFLKPKECARLV